MQKCIYLEALAYAASMLALVHAFSHTTILMQVFKSSNDNPLPRCNYVRNLNASHPTKGDSIRCHESASVERLCNAC